MSVEWAMLAPAGSDPELFFFDGWIGVSWLIVRGGPTASAPASPARGSGVREAERLLAKAEAWRAAMFGADQDSRRVELWGELFHQRREEEDGRLCDLLAGRWWDALGLIVLREHGDERRGAALVDGRALVVFGEDGSPCALQLVREVIPW